MAKVKKDELLNMAELLGSSEPPETIQKKPTTSTSKQEQHQETLLAQAEGETSDVQSLLRNPKLPPEIEDKLDEKIKATAEAYWGQMIQMLNDPTADKDIRKFYLDDFIRRLELMDTNKTVDWNKYKEMFKKYLSL
ncbi:MAG: hypothetical protein ACP5OF_01520 [bacterium]